VLRERCKVVHLTSVHPPFDSRVFYKECRTLAEAGYEVVLVASHDQDEMVEGVRIRAVPKSRGRVERITRTVKQVYRAALAEDAKVYHFHDPELIPVGFLLKQRGKKIVYDVHEDVPKDVLSKYYLPRPFRRSIAMLAAAVETLGATIFDAVVTAIPAIARRFPPRKTVVIQNFPMIDELFDAEAYPYVERPPHVAYVGGIAEIRGAREMVRAMSFLPTSLDAQLVMAGSFSPPELEKQLGHVPGWERTQYIGWLTRNEVAHLLGRVRGGLVLFHPEANNVEAQPTKLFEYMSAGIPVVASDFPLWREIVDGAGCGLLVNPLSPQAIADAVRWLLEHPGEAEAMGRRGRDAVLSRYNWGLEKTKMLQLYDDLLAPTRRRNRI